MHSRINLLAVALVLVVAAVASNVVQAADPRPAPSVAQPRRIALIVGNSRYATSPLTNPTRDADLLARTLGGLGFDVRLVKDASQNEMKRAIQNFGADLEKAGADAVGLFYYAGHGLQMNGRNFLIPVGAHIERDADVEIEAVSADWVLEEMRYARNRLNFVILDACRNNPFARSFRGGASGLARMDAPAGVLIAYSTAPGEVAEDGAGSNSPYSEALARAMVQRHEPAELMFKHARDDVRTATAQRQTPWESSSLTGQDFVFAGTAVAKVPEIGPTQVPAASAAASPPTAPARSQEASRAEFMEDALCANAAAKWKVEGEALTGSVQLNADASAEISPRGKSAIAARWDCDASNRKITVSFGVDEHQVVMDGSEKLLFGYNRRGVSVIYTR